MKRLTLILISAVLLPLGSRAALAQNTVTVSGDPALLRISTAVPGSEPASETNAVTTYTVVVTTGGARRITGRLLAALPVGTTVTVSLAAPPGATSLGPVTLDLTERDLVVGIPRPSNSTHTITYTFTTTVTAGVIPNTSSSVRLRLRI